MSKNEVIKYLTERVDTMEHKLKDLDSQIAKLTEERSGIAKAYDSYKHTLRNESEEVGDDLNPIVQEKPSGSFNFANLPIHQAAEVILKQTIFGMTSRELTEEIIKRGKKMVGPNSVTIVANSLRRFPDQFKRTTDGKWTLIIKEGHTRAA
jgi:hypothetical protein